jgi:hypothetical protein
VGEEVRNMAIPAVSHIVERRFFCVSFFLSDRLDLPLLTNQIAGIGSFLGYFCN